jgi:hypothetical protein
MFIACACIGGGEKWDKNADAGDMGSSISPDWTGGAAELVMAFARRTEL